MSEPAAVTPKTRSTRIVSVAGGVGGELFFYGLFWGGIVIGLLTLNLAATGIFGTVESSVWAESGMFTRYLFDVAGVMALTACLPMYLGYGITRRDFVAGAIPGALAVAFLAALVATLLFAVEGLLYEVADWPHVLDGDAPEHLYDRPDQYGAIFVEWFAVFGSHLMAGLLIGSSFLRLGPLAAVLLPLTALPAIVTEMVLGAGAAGGALNEALDLSPPPVAVGLLVTVALVAAAWVGVRLFTRDIAVDNHRVMWWR